MNQANGTKTEKTIQRVSHKNFYALTEELRNQREQLLKERPTLKTLAEQLSKKLKCNVTTYMIRQAKECTGIDWQPKNSTASPNNLSLRHNASRTAIRYLIHLYEQLGQESPPILLRTLNALEPKFKRGSEDLFSEEVLEDIDNELAHNQ